MSVDDWEIRIFGRRMGYYLATRGFGHLQLWHPRARISVLTPSRLTRGCWEIFPVAGWKTRERWADGAASVVRSAGFDLPSLPLLTTLLDALGTVAGTSPGLFPQGKAALETRRGVAGTRRTK